MLKELEKSPENVHLMYRIAKAYQKNKDDYEASLMYKEILKHDPEDKYGYKIESLFWNASYDGVIWKKPEGLIAFITEYSEYKDIKDAYRWLAKTYKRRGEMDKAVQVYMDALEVFKNDADFYNHFAWWVYENKQEKQYDVAIEYAKSAAEMKLDAWYIWDTLAWLYHENNERDKAIAAAQKALSIAPESEQSECKQALERIKKGKK
jgi:tetratricopeptide (TPR) repeat protein